MLKKVLIRVAAVAAVLIAGFAVVVAIQPSEFHVERSATMAAPAGRVFAQVNDFHHWQAWSPWAELDPTATNSFEGPPSGEGAVFRWAGNADVGEGSMTITESRPDELIRIRLDFVKPFEDTADVAFTFKPDGERTAVTWSMDGKNNFIAKALCLFMDMDEMIGGSYEQGLLNIKKIVEGTPGRDAGEPDPPAPGTEG